MKPKLSAQNVVKRFPGVVALDGVSVEVAAGECHALVGENGAGKSTLAKLFGGLYRPDGGQLLHDGKPLELLQPLDAIHLGIGLVHQELLFCENLTVAENLCLDNLPTRMGALDSREMERRARAWLEEVGADIDPWIRLGELPVSRQQLVQIAGAIGKGASVLIFDEPSSCLSQVETQRLLQLISQLKTRGVTCIYVSHRLEEVFAVADSISVLRDGKLVRTLATKDATPGSLVSLMIGRDLDLSATTPPPPADGEELLTARELGTANGVEGVSLSVRSGEIVGLAGLVGAGRTEIAEALFGAATRTSGAVLVRGKSVRADPRRMFGSRVGLVPEDRKRHGLVLGMPAGRNVSLAVLAQLARAGVIRRRVEKQMVAELFERLRVKAPSPGVPAGGLSGGNQQKLVLAKWLAADCDVLIVDEPTRGVDVGAKAEIHGILRGLAAQGKGILLISSELPELLALATRLLVVRAGRIVAEVPRVDATEELLLWHMSGT